MCLHLAENKPVWLTLPNHSHSAAPEAQPELQICTCSLFDMLDSEKASVNHKIPSSFRENIYLFPHWTAPVSLATSFNTSKINSKQNVAFGNHKMCVVLFSSEQQVFFKMSILIKETKERKVQILSQ